MPPREPWKPDAMPPATEMLARGVAGLLLPPGRIARTAFRTARSLCESSEALGAVAHTLGLDRLPLAGGWLRRQAPQVDADPIPQTPAPRTPFNRSITPHRRFAFFSLPLADLKHVKTAFGTTLNDVVMAVSGSRCAATSRARARCRRAAQGDGAGVGAHREPEARLHQPRHAGAGGARHRDRRPGRAAPPHPRAMKSAKRMQQAMPATLLQDWTQFATPRCSRRRRASSRARG